MLYIANNDLISIYVKSKIEFQICHSLFPILFVGILGMCAILAIFCIDL